MTTPPMFSISLARLSLCFAPLFLLACLDEDTDLAATSSIDSLDPEFDGSSGGMDVAAPGKTQRSGVGQQATLLTIDLMTHQDAVCNDGSAPVVKVNLDPNGGTNWLVYLQGGGNCDSDDSCEWRWEDCDPSPAHSQGGQAIGGKRNMMADSGAMNFDGWGILDFDGHGVETSPFAGHGFNRVFIPYCSSDNWRGLGNSQTVNFAATCGNPAGLTEIHFAGGAIVDAVIDEIMASQQAPEDGDFIVLAGGSAGGQGVQYNLDRVADQAQAVEPGITVAGVADASLLVGLDQDGIPNSVPVDSELYWAGLDPAVVVRNPGDSIDVVVDDSCWSTEVGADKEYCQSSAYVTPKHVDNALMLTSNTYDNAGHGGTLASLSAFWPSDCGVTVIDTSGLDPDMDALYFEYCDPAPGVDPTDDVKTWIRYQIGVEGPVTLTAATNLAYYITHSSLGLHDQLLKQSGTFYRRATDLAQLNVIGNYEFAGLGGWTSLYGDNSDPSVASTVGCALGLIGLAGAPTCDPADVRVTSTLPTQVPVIEDFLN